MDFRSTKRGANGFKRWLLSVPAAAVLAGMAADPAQAQQASPLDSLLPHMRVLTPWGQRPEWSRDGRWIYFLPKAFSEVFRIEVATGRIEPVTTHYFHEGYNRVLALANGDLLLAGPDEFDSKDPWKVRHKLQMSVLKAPFRDSPVPLGRYCDEGPAVSRSDLRIAWTLPGQREIRTGRIEDENGRPVLKDEKTVLSFDRMGRPLSHRLETQDFVPGRNQLIFTYYRGTVEEPFYYADAYILDLDTGSMSDLTQSPNTYDEAEGIAPDGSFLLIESDRHTVPEKWLVDVYLMPLDGRGGLERLADWTRFPGYRSDNPVVSPDGKTIAIQCGFMKGSGQGSGIVLLDLERYRAGR
jgi:hypothetical protein